jgi:hypothetical protein
LVSISWCITNISFENICITTLSFLGIYNSTNYIFSFSNLWGCSLKFTLLS